LLSTVAVLMVRLLSKLSESVSATGSIIRISEYNASIM
jgi:hypothetical protein